MGKLEEKVAVITGAGSGMGRAMANLFASEGAKVIAAEWHQATLDEVVAEVQAGGGAITGVQGDVSKLEDCEKIVQTAIDTYGRIDVLCNNAGIMDNFADPLSVDDAILQRVMSINAFGPLYLTRAAVRYMLDNGGGSIVNSSSMAGVGGGAAGTAYTMSKHAVLGLTRSTAWHYAKRGVRCNAMIIGGVATNIMQNTALGVDQGGMDRAMEYAKLAPAFLQPMDVANLALFLASDAASGVNGAVVNVDAGWGCA